MNEAREDFLAGARFAGDEDRDVGRGDAARGGEKGLHLLGKEECAGFCLDGVGRPERGAVAFLLTKALQCQRGAANPEDVGE